MVSVCVVAPAVSEEGDSDVTVGTGLVAETVKLTADEEPPPGAGFVTTTGYEPAVARSAVASEMVNWLALT
jgi:hypothetical protein